MNFYQFAPFSPLVYISTALGYASALKLKTNLRKRQLKRQIKSPSGETSNLTAEWAGLTLPPSATANPLRLASLLNAIYKYLGCRTSKQSCAEIGTFPSDSNKAKNKHRNSFFLCYSKFRGSWRPQTRGNGNKFNITNVDIWAGNCNSQQFSSPARRGAGKKKEKEIRPQQNILKMISFNLRSASCHLFPRNTKHKHWPLSRWRRANISLDKHLEDKSWHEAPSQKKNT